MEMYPIVFYFLSALILLAGLGVVLFANPIYSALSLSLTMLFLAGLFFLLGAQFLAAVQLIVYAGAVVVLFVMVLMLFDLKKEKKPFSGTWASLLGKISAVGLGFLLLAIPTWRVATGTSSDWLAQRNIETLSLAEHLFSKHLFAFESVGVMLTIVLVGVIALAKAKGGTHARDE